MQKLGHGPTVGEEWMRHIVFLALAVVLALVAPNMVLADGDYITDVAQALQSTPVYVAPRTEGTDIYTASKLKERLTKGDNIVLVMLPAAAEAELGDISTIATRLSETLGNQRIIGLSVGKKTIGYAPSLPEGVAADQMKRAQSVSNDPVTALGTFAQNVHLWQVSGPKPTPTPIPTPVPSSQDENWPSSDDWTIALLFVAALLVVGGTVGGLIARSSNRANQNNPERTYFEAPNQKVKDLLAQIARERARINDSELQQVLYQMCVDIEKYFQRSSKDKERDALFFKERLSEVVAVLVKYVDVQQSPRYYYEPVTELRRGKESIIDFSQYVLDSIRRGHAADLLDYTVNTKILQAQRYR